MAARETAARTKPEAASSGLQASSGRRRRPAAPCRAGAVAASGVAAAARGGPYNTGGGSATDTNSTSRLRVTLICRMPTHEPGCRSTEMVRSGQRVQNRQPGMTARTKSRLQAFRFLQAGGGRPAAPGRAVAVAVGGVAAAALGRPTREAAAATDTNSTSPTRDPGCRSTEWCDPASGCKTGSRE